MEKNKEFYISPNLENDDLTETINCINEAGENIEIPVVKEIPLTIYLNKQEIVTAMTLGDMPDILAVGYLLNQNMLQRDDIISEIDYDEDLQVVIIRTKRTTNYEKKMEKNKEFYISPNLEDDNLTETINCINEAGENIEIPVVKEIPLTIYLNKQEIVTAMTLGDMPDILAVGYLLNQNMLQRDDVISEIDYDEDLQVVIIRTKRTTNYEKKMEKKIRTSGCAVGTVYGDIMDDFSSVNLNKDAKIKTSWIYTISKKVNTRPSLYLKAGALHGCVLCKNDSPIVYVEDVGRHNAVDKIAGWMFLNKENANDKIFYTTGRLTSEMVIKTVQMGIPILISRSGFTESGVRLARESGLTLIGRAKGKRMIIANGIERVVFDTDVQSVKSEDVVSAQRALIK